MAALLLLRGSLLPRWDGDGGVSELQVLVVRQLAQHHNRRNAQQENGAQEQSSRQLTARTYTVTHPHRSTAALVWCPRPALALAAGTMVWLGASALRPADWCDSAVTRCAALL
tara:strand:- start:12857 stop:13195 length:339 start_codon:yes stop_codon:yes gene_type:complete